MSLIALLLWACTSNRPSAPPPEAPATAARRPPILQVDVVDPVVAKAVWRIATPAAERSALQPRDIGARPSPGDPDFQTALQAVGSSGYALVAYHEACSPTLAQSLTQAWRCADGAEPPTYRVDHPEHCPIAPLESGVEGLEALAKAHFLEDAERIMVMCLESCASSGACPAHGSPRPQGALAVDRCMDAFKELEAIAAARGLPDLTDRVRLLAWSCDRRGMPVEFNAEMQSTLFWFQFPSTWGAASQAATPPAGEAEG